MEEQINLAKVAEDHAKKASADASRLAEELRQEQDHSSQIEKARRTAETIAKDLQTRLDEAEAAAMQGGRKIVQKMEQVRYGFETARGTGTTPPNLFFVPVPPAEKCNNNHFEKAPVAVSLS